MSAKDEGSLFHLVSRAGHKLRAQPLSIIVLLDIGITLDSFSQNFAGLVVYATCNGRECQCRSRNLSCRYMGSSPIHFRGLKSQGNGERKGESRRLFQGFVSHSGSANDSPVSVTSQSIQCQGLRELV